VPKRLEARYPAMLETQENLALGATAGNPRHSPTLRQLEKGVVIPITNIFYFFSADRITAIPGLLFL